MIELTVDKQSTIKRFEVTKCTKEASTGKGNFPPSLHLMEKAILCESVAEMIPIMNCSVTE